MAGNDDHVSIRFEGVSKKFRRGERHDSLRDMIPALVRKTFSREQEEELKEREFWAVRDVTFDVARGEALGIIGHNGAGKSTILKLLSGILRPNRGRIRMNGRFSALIEIGAGFHPDLTGRENVYLNGVILGMTKQEISRKFDEIVDFAGLPEFIDTPVKRYSSGMYARLGFSIAAHMDPDILLVDEVLSVGDWAFQSKCIDKMHSFIDKGITVIFVSHNLQAVAGLCRRTILMDRGRVDMSGPTDEVVHHYLTKVAAPACDRGEDREVAIREVGVHNAAGEPSSCFGSGEQACVIVDLQARTAVQGLSISVEILDRNHYSIFDVSSERLGIEGIDLAAGETKRIAFDLTLHLSPGHFYLNTMVKKSGLGGIYDTRYPAATLIINTDRDIRGSVNLYPVFRVEDERNCRPCLTPIK